MTAPQHPSCPSCGAPDALVIVYGYPDDELMAAALRGELLIGGCIVSPDNPTRECQVCGFSWQQAGDEVVPA